MNWFDRLLCKIQGHTWYAPLGHDARQCAHCGLWCSAIQLVSLRRARSVRWVSASEALDLGWPNRLTLGAVHMLRRYARACPFGG